MTSDQARDLQREMKRVVSRLRAGHLEAEDVLMVARTVEEVLAHIANALEARSRKPRVN